MRVSITTHLFMMLWLPTVLVCSILIYAGLTSINWKCGSADYEVCPLKSLFKSKVNIPDHFDVYPRPRQIIKITSIPEFGTSDWDFGKICLTYSKGDGEPFMTLNGQSLGQPDELEDGLMPFGPMYACWQAPTYIGYYQVELKFNDGQYQYYWWYEITN